MATLLVLAGANGAGKSSIAGEMLRARGADYFNPDERTQQIRSQYPRYSLAEANSLAWHTNVIQLRDAIAQKQSYAFETTLGGHTVPQLIRSAAQAGLAVRLWYVGLCSVQLHLERIATRVAAGGHDIPEAKVRERYEASLRNLVELMPHLEELRVFDNSAPAPPPHTRPKAVLHVVGRQVQFPATVEAIRATPEWAKPLVAKAYC